MIEITMPYWFFYFLGLLIAIHIVDTGMMIALRILKHKVVKMAAKQAAKTGIGRLKVDEYD